MKKLLMCLFVCIFTIDSFANDIAANITNPVCDNATLEKYNGTANIEINWEPNTIDLRWYDGETRLTVPTESQSCTYDGAMYIPPQPTKTGYTFKGWEVKYAIPEEYTEVEYLESDASRTQYIDTGIYQNTSLNSVETYAGFGYSVLPTRRELTGFNGNQDNYFGVTPLDNGKIVFEICNFGSYSVVANTKYDIYTKQSAGVMTLKAYLNNTLVDDITSMQGLGKFTYSQLRFFNLSGYNATYGMTHARIYYYRILMDNVLVGNFIPVRRNSDGELGLYDTVSKTFLTNSGTGSFIAGPDL